MRQKIQQDTWDVLLRGEASPTDADDVYFMAFHGSRVGSGNISGYHTAALDALLSSSRRHQSSAWGVWHATPQVRPRLCR